MVPGAAHRATATAAEPEHAKAQPDRQADDAQDGGDHAAHAAGRGRGAAAGVHAAGVHLLEVVVAHDPGHRTQDDPRDEEREDAEQLDRVAAVRRQPTPRAAQVEVVLVVVAARAARMVVIVVVAAGGGAAGGRPGRRAARIVRTGAAPTAGRR